MIVLAFDTAGVDCAAAIYETESDRVLAERCERIGKGHAERLTDMIREVLEEAGLPISGVGRIAVTIGPGSFTGIRTGVAAARGFALSLGVPAAGVTTLQIMAADFRERHPGEPVVVAMDARRGEIYTQAFDVDGMVIGPAEALDAVAVGALAARLGARVFGSAAPLVAGENSGGEPDRYPLRLAARLASAIMDPEKPKPLYLRAPDAKLQAGFALSRT